MQVEFSPAAYEYLMEDSRAVDYGDGPVILQHANQHSRLFVQQLQQHPGWDAQCDRIVVDRDKDMLIGGTPYDVLLFTLSRAGYSDKTVIIRASDVQDRHPDPRFGGELLFRGQRLIEEVLAPAVTGLWVEADE